MEKSFKKYEQIYCFWRPEPLISSARAALAFLESICFGVSEV